MKRRGFLKGLVAASMLSVGAVFPKREVKLPDRPIAEVDTKFIEIYREMLNKEYMKQLENMLIYGTTHPEAWHYENSVV